MILEFCPNARRLFSVVVVHDNHHGEITLNIQFGELLGQFRKLIHGNETILTSVWLGDADGIPCIKPEFQIGVLCLVEAGGGTRCGKQ